MKHWSIETGRVMACLCALSLTGSVGRAAPPGADVFVEIEELIESLYLKEAEVRLQGLSNEEAAFPKARYLRGKLAFFQGSYVSSHGFLVEAIETSKTELDWKSLRDRVQVSIDTVKSTTTETGRRDRFHFVYQDRQDAVLISRADDALNRQYDALQGIFSDSPEVPVRVYILNSVAAFAVMCGLSSERIEATATVAMSRYNRIMILSPRIVSDGYPWLDTLAHELTHVFVTRLSRNRAPVWFGEGVAKNYEGLWRNLPQGELTPEEAYLLERAAAERRLIPFRRFHPSVSFLPSQEDAALAYAQAMSFIQFVGTHSTDEAWVATVLRDTGAGQPLDALLTRTARSNTRKLQGWWEKETTSRRLAPTKLAPFLKKRFSAGTQSRDIADQDLYTMDVRRQLRLGDLLRLRGHLREALEKYEYAAELNGVAVPDIAQRIAGCYIDLNQYDHAVDFLTPLLRLYPFQAALHNQLAQAQFRKDKPQEAILALLQTIAIDPFLSQVHCRLGAAYRRIGDVNNAVAAENHCRLLQSEPPALMQKADANKKL